MIYQDLLNYFQKFYQLVLKPKLNDSFIDSEWAYFTSMIKTQYNNSEKQRIDLYFNVLETEKKKKNQQSKPHSSNSIPNIVVPYNKLFSKQNRKLNQQKQTIQNTNFQSVSSTTLTFQSSGLQKYSQNNKSYKRITEKNNNNLNTSNNNCSAQFRQQSFSNKKQLLQSHQPLGQIYRFQKRNSELPEINQLQKRHSIRNQNQQNYKLLKLIHSTNKLLNVFQDTQNSLSSKIV